MTLVLVTAPSVEPVSLAEAKLHCRIDVTDDDALVTAQIVAARAYCEQWTRRALITQTWEDVLNEWPLGREHVLPLAPLASIVSVKYTDDAGVEATMPAGDYLVDSTRTPGRIVLRSSASWPSVALQESHGVRIRFTAGYGAAASTVPQSIRQGLLLLIGTWYENREAMAFVVGMPTEIPHTIQALWRPYQVARF